MGRQRFDPGGAVRTIVLSSTLVLLLCAWIVIIQTVIARNHATVASLALELSAVILLGIIGASAGTRWSRQRSALLDATARAREVAQDSLSRLGEATQLMRAIVDTSPVATIAIDGQRRVTFWSAGAEAMLGWSADEVTGRPMPQELGGEEPEPRPRPLHSTDVVSGERARWRTRDGRERIVEIYAAPLRRDGVIEGFAGQAFDITDREHERLQLIRLIEAIDQTVDSIVISDASGAIVYANEAFARKAGCEPADLVGGQSDKVFRELFGPELMKSMDEMVRDGEPWFGEVEHGQAGQPAARVELSLTPLREVSGAVAGTIALMRDVTYIRAIESDLALEAAVTGMLRGAVHLVAPETALQDAAAAVCDGLTSIGGIDFAAVLVFFNPSDAALVAISAPDSLSLGAGDPLPPSLADRLFERALDGAFGESWVSRPGDDEFGAALDRAGLKALAFAPIFHNGHIDGGVAIGTSDPAFAVTLAERFPPLVDFSTAPTALLAKRLHDHKDNAVQRRETAETIDKRAFHPVFQPIVELASGSVVGYEALTRFDGGRRPDLAFAAARSVGLGLELEVATLDAALWAGRELPAGSWLDVNISPALLTERNTLKRSLAVADRMVVLEITEHEPVADYLALRNAVESLGTGVRLAVDDAGAGVANFAHILEMNAHLIKLDISLVRGVDTSPARQALVVAMNHFAGSVGCRLVAEGIETEAEVVALRQFGVEFGQGYWFGRPEPLPRTVNASPVSATR
jgi:PAS domain S-box-containing protein